jgi:hypothetical protein
MEPRRLNRRTEDIMPVKKKSQTTRKTPRTKIKDLPLMLSEEQLSQVTGGQRREPASCTLNNDMDYAGN